ncbi:unnamed protein product [Caenorhabditis angaria]|uniref:Uncharacterized protein n=1 Tax=Caenorhabditis angaria TaxID=860376 RepID=A0A9P1N7D9_9PELO|nr:unnamed protein product [Caenorhabditis angaria]
MGCNQSSSKVGDVPGKSPEIVEPPPPAPAVAPPQNANNGNALTVPPSTAPSPKPSLSRMSTPNHPPSIQANSDDGYNNIRLLLLGSAESGKTTLLQQVRLLYKQPFTESEIFHRRAFIYFNIFKSIKSLVTAMNTFEQAYEDPINAGRAQAITEDYDRHMGMFAPEMVNRIKTIWKDKGIQKMYARRSSFNLNDSAGYFLDNIDKINQANYMPNEKDLIMSYVPTVGVQNVIFTANKNSFQLFDIGGQRIDRRKWATQYDGIDAIFFCLAISEYDQVMMEDLETNRLDDALQLLKKISDEPKFEKTPIYLFLNEVDVFREKLSEIPLEQFKPKFQGGNEEDALEFIESLAMEALGSREKNLYRVYRSIAIDTKMMSEMLTAVIKDIIKKKK